jgi:hypothetical protein
MTVEIDYEAIQAMGKDRFGPVGKVIEQKAVVTETIAKVLMKIPGTGRYYGPGSYFLTRGFGPARKVYHWTRHSGHQASAPGEPAASDTGYSAAQIGHRIEVRQTVVGIVEGKSKYFIYTELGTRYMKPRPVLRPALSAAMRK